MAEGEAVIYKPTKKVETIWGIEELPSWVLHVDAEWNR